MLIFFRLPELETEFNKLRLKEENRPAPLSNMPDIYSDFVHSTYALAHNVVCASCGVIGHDPSLYFTFRKDNVLLRVFAIPRDTYVPFDFSTGIPNLDDQSS